MRTTHFDIPEFHITALEKLGEGLADYMQKTAGEGNTFRSNLHAFAGYRIVCDPHSNVTALDTSVDILGMKITAPVMIAPTAWHGMFTPKGETATYAAAKAFGTVHCISSFSSRSFQQIADPYELAFNPLSNAWYQLLMYKDLDLMKHYIDEAIDAGCSGIVITVDAVTGCSMCKKDPNAPVLEFPMHKLPIFPENPRLPYTTLDDYYGKYMPMKLDWRAVQEIVSYARVPVILKGVLTTGDVRNAINAGAKAVIISNHGGRQNDSLPATLKALAMLPSDLRDNIDIYLDGGIRDGSDAFKALALGAKAVFIGRPALCGLAVRGESGLLDVLNIFRDGLSQCMQMTGCESLADITSDKVAKED